MQPIIVEVQIDRAGCFVKVQTTTMFGSVDEALEFMKKSKGVAREEFSRGSGGDYMEIEDTETGILGVIHAYGKKS